MPQGKKNKKRKTRQLHQSLTNQGEIDGIFEKAFGHHQNGELEKANELYQQILLIEPNHADALQLSGIISYENKDFSTALSLIKRAISVHSDRPVYHYNMGLVYSEHGDYDDALESFIQAIALQPDYYDAIYRAGLSCHNLDDIESAINYYKKALELKPDNAEIWNNLGNIAQNLSKFGDALEYYNHAVGLNPHYAEAYNNLGNLYSKTGQPGNACTCYLKALELKPGLAQAYTNLGNIRHDESRFEEAIDCYNKALHINPICTETAFRLGVAYNSMSKSDEALYWFKRVIEAQPGHGKAHQNIVSILEYRCDWLEISGYLASLKKLTKEGLIKNEISPEAPFSCLCRHTEVDYHTRVTESWSRDYESIPEKLGIRFNLDTRYRSQRKLVVGYLSNNFRNHPNAHLVSGLFEHQDRQRFQVNCYSYGADDKSYYRRRIEAGCDRFVDIRGLGFIESARQIYDDKVDILIDFNGYTTGNKMEICALRPAPLQVRYLGFPGSMRASFFDYLVTDKILTPPEEQNHYTEKFVYMPECYQINDNTPIAQDKHVDRNECGLPSDGVVFCSFNTSYKIESVMFKVWMNILNQVPESVLWLLSGNKYMVGNLKNTAAEHGVDPDRLVFAEKLPKNDHLVRLGLADLALDTRLVGGHLTTSDALRAGVPVLTLQGNHFISRASSSILSHLGLKELVTVNLYEYEKKAVELATDGDALQKIKSKLVKNLLTASLFDTPRFVKNFEKGLLQMWDIYCAGNPPEQIDVAQLFSEGQR